MVQYYFLIIVQNNMYIIIINLKIASLEYKIFGLGYLNQPSTLVIERDILMSILTLEY